MTVTRTCITRRKKVDTLHGGAIRITALHGTMDLPAPLLLWQLGWHLPPLWSTLATIITLLLLDAPEHSSWRTTLGLLESQIGLPSLTGYLETLSATFQNTSTEASISSTSPDNFFLHGRSFTMVRQILESLSWYLTRTLIFSRQLPSCGPNSTPSMGRRVDIRFLLTRNFRGDGWCGIGEEGCFLHLCKRLDFQVKELGLLSKYRVDDPFKLTS